jgi:hypothetical protein
VCINSGDGSCYVCMLIHTRGVRLESTMNVNIYNQCSDFKLKDGRYFNTGIDLDEGIDEKVHAGDMTSVALYFVCQHSKVF